MEDAQITQDDQPMYQAAEYPSVVDTDDIIYELGKQVVDSLNKEKLIKMAASKVKMIQDAAVSTDRITEDIKASNEKLREKLDEKEKELKELKDLENSVVRNESEELAALRKSNKKYEENNKKLDEELVKIRKQLGV